MKQRLAVAFGFVCATLMAGVEAQATGPFAVRCGQDDMAPGVHIRRNAWAFKCGYITAKQRAFHDSEDEYVIFEEQVAPIDPDAECKGYENMHILGWCYAKGCYTSNQRIMFGPRGYTPISEAVMGYYETVSGFADNWMPGDEISLVDEKVKSYTVGDQFSGVLVIITETGKRVEVTDTHPLVADDGRVIAAKKVIPGETKLLTVSGPDLVTSVQTMPYVGKVWNVEPASTRVRANLHLAEDFVVGSVRYQNEWADDEYRRSLRNNLDLADF